MFALEHLDHPGGKVSVLHRLKYNRHLFSHNYNTEVATTSG